LVFQQAYPQLPIKADFKLVEEDFFVAEELGFEPSGEGEHLLLYIRKKNITTEMLVSDLAKLFKLKTRDIGFCGLKDKKAVTEQWLSVHLPIKDSIPDVAGYNWQLIKGVRHNKKLRRGIHKGNRFVIQLRNIEGDASLLEERLKVLGEEGFPNYFGWQRFGGGGSNVEKAERLFLGELKCKPFQRSLFYSAARSYLFNHFLSLRIQSNTWNNALSGDCFNLDGTNAIFGPEDITADIERRIIEKDIHPVGPLFGVDNLRLESKSLEVCEQVANQFPVLVAGLVAAKIKTAWRPLRVMPKSLNWKLNDQSCELMFSLPVGSYATALIHELVTLNEAVW
jgi:tRNA pseudouridine13 synthase